MKKIAFIIVIAIVAFIGIYVGKEFVGQSSSVGSKKQVLVAHSTKDTQKITPQISQITKSIPTRVAPPKTIRIPKLNVTGVIEQVGLDSKKAMDVPKNADNAGWYQKGSRPGERGNAVIAGHLDKESGAPAIFYHLTSLQKGDRIYILDEEGKEHVFVVLRMQKYPYNAFPIGEVFGKTDKAMLNIITCQGNWDSANKNYSHRYVTYSELVK